MTLEERLQYFEKHFEFYKDPDYFRYNYDPEQSACRNEALRTGNRELYLKFIKYKYPGKEIEAMADFDQVELRSMGREEGLRFFKANKINVLNGDLEYSDPDTIFKMLTVKEADLFFYTEESEIDLINSYNTPEEVFKVLDVITVDMASLRK
ncbi:hypothetical protein [Sphingobacterium yanglingense]|uniref:Uncharacterized protein n=1 Tax=Sphingobacterium yanglingense TaxID=1437280 RepID=A0A4R6WHE6_9SPHI|nr:hypothetical protein [Sphingobacterium yanglingense]TDQ79603.1 hypothetical protein CLV99_1048 [Sphingobacterium yanglingense]